MDNFEFIQTLSVLEIKQGDILVVKANRTMVSLELKQSLIEIIKPMLSSMGLDDVRILILEAGMDIGVVRKG